MTNHTSQLWRFHGGLHLAPNKAQSTHAPIASMPLPTRLIVPLQQHIGTSAEVGVEIGAHVLKGQVIGRAVGYVSAPIHAPSSGTVVEIAERPIPHPSGMSATCIVIDTDGRDEWTPVQACPDYQSLDPSALRNRIREAGIVGLGGAGFPAFIKLNPASAHGVDTLILNGAECEPYIACDDMLMRERADAIVRGAQIMRHALLAKRCLIGIEDNKPEAFAALAQAIRQCSDTGIEIVPVPTIYPAGGEKQLIKVLTGKEVPSGGLPLEIGVICHNVATAVAVDAALNQGRPLLSRVVTVAGAGVRTPCNLDVLVGTPVSAVIAACGGYTDDAKRLIMGGPMMGFTLDNDAVPIVKTSNCILVAAAAEAPDPPPALPCIRCGACAEVCPALLLPQQLYWHSRAKEFDKVQDYRLFDCIECGCCAYVCPSHIPLVQYYRYAKTEIWAQERDKRKADLARQRHEFRLQRQQRDKAERDARMQQKKAALNSGGNQDARQKAAIQAALQRVKEKQLGAANAPEARPDRSKDEEHPTGPVDPSQSR